MLISLEFPLRPGYCFPSGYFIKLLILFLFYDRFSEDYFSVSLKLSNI